MVDIEDLTEEQKQKLLEQSDVPLMVEVDDFDLPDTVDEWDEYLTEGDTRTQFFERVREEAGYRGKAESIEELLVNALKVVADAAGDDEPECVQAFEERQAEQADAAADEDGEEEE